MQDCQANYQDKLSEMERVRMDLLQRFSEEKAQLESALAALQRRWENRESRPEDVEALKQADQKIWMLLEERKKLQDEVKYYKLELVNRDESYHKIFGGKSPVVGNVLTGTIGGNGAGLSLNLRGTPTASAAAIGSATASDMKDHGSFSFPLNSTKAGNMQKRK